MRERIGKIPFSIRVCRLVRNIRKWLTRSPSFLFVSDIIEYFVVEEYALVQKTWSEKGWKILREMLVYYNLLDCAPFIQAVGNLLIPYKQQNLDIFKRSFLVRGIAKLRMMQKIEKNIFFVYSQKDTRICIKL